MIGLRMAAGLGAVIVALGQAPLVTTPAAASPQGAPARTGAVETGPDDDGDGMTGLADACPTSPPRATPLAHGCSAVEIVRRPEVITAQTLEGLDAILPELRESRQLADARTYLEQAGEQIDSFTSWVRKGEVCRADTAFGAVEDKLRMARQAMHEGVESLAGELLDFQPRAGDASAGDVTVGYLRMLAGRLDGVVETGLEAGGRAAALCAAADGNLAKSGLIRDVDDAAGLLTLGAGPVLALASSLGTSARPQRLHEGRRVSVTGTAFQDGTGVVKRVGDQPNPRVSKATPTCMVLRIAPVQPFSPYDAGPYTLHKTQAYANGGDVLQLEQGMRLSADELSCPSNNGQGLSFRYVMRIDVIDNPNPKQVLAFEFDDGDHPVAFPPGSEWEGQIKTTVMRLGCKLLANGDNQCQAPVVQKVRYYDATLRPRGHYSTAVFSQTTFEVLDNKVANDFDSTTVVAMDLTDVPLGSQAHFVGEGYAITNGNSSRPQVVEVDQGEPFAIYDEDDFIPDGLVLFELDIVGVDHESGLRWPRVQGVRNGSSFWYSSLLPSIVRDQVSTCPDDPDTWYRLPFYGGWPDWIVNTGNHGDPIHGHGSSQPYAWDLNADTGTDIAAARGGTVVWVVEDEHLNAKDYPKDPNDPTEVDPAYKKIGNYIWILHADGTVATYNHLAQWGALVSEGDVVHRGDHIGEVGNTGYSSQSHLHYEGGLETVDWHTANPSVVKLPTRFEGMKGTFNPNDQTVNYTYKDCWVPNSGDLVLSTQ